MNSLKKLPVRFSHIYIEKEILDDPETKRICTYFPNAVKIPVARYTDVFDRRRQSFPYQHANQNLILAKKHDHFIYPGSPVCQDFSYDNFYYCAPVMNCIYDCEYCWLKGLYPSGNLVIFVNQEDYFKECVEILSQHPLYLCISFDADLLSLEPLLGYAQRWAEFTAEHENLTIEIRTKAASYQNWTAIPVNKRVVFAFTLSPEEVIKRYEHGTPLLEKRLDAIEASLKAGRTVRVCIDPMMPVPDWQQAYHDLVERIKERVSFDEIKDISVGTFRLASGYLKKMREAYPDSAVIQYPYVCEKGFYHLPFHLNEDMEKYMIDELKQYVSEEKIFCWEEL